MHRPACLISAWVLAIAALIVGCDRKAEPPPETQPEPESLVRVVSLAPAITQVLVDIDQARLIVGVGQNDAAAPRDAAVVGTFLDINSEALAGVRPTHVFTMAGKSGPPARLTELAAARKFEVYTYPFPTSVQDVAEMIFSDSELLPDAPGPKPATPSISAVLSPHDPTARIAAQGVKYKMLNQLDALQRVTAEGGSPSVLMLIGTDPLTASGSGEVLNDLLTRYLNARNVAADLVGGAPVLDREKVLSLKPDVILVLLPDAAELGPIDQDERLAALRGLDVPAVRDGRVALINDPAVHHNSSTLARVGRAMAKAIYPDLAGAIDAALLSPTTQPAQSDDPAKLPDAADHDH